MHAGVRLLVGPVVGPVTATTARVLVEVDGPATLALHACTLDSSSSSSQGGGLQGRWCSSSEPVAVTGRRPAVLTITGLPPGEGEP